MDLTVGDKVRSLNGLKGQIVRIEDIGVLVHLHAYRPGDDTHMICKPDQLNVIIFYSAPAVPPPASTD